MSPGNRLTRRAVAAALVLAAAAAPAGAFPGMSAAPSAPPPEAAMSAPAPAPPRPAPPTVPAPPRPAGAAPTAAPPVAPPVPAGQIVFQLVDERGQAVVGHVVELHELRRSVADGDQSRRRTVTTDERGVGVFDGLVATRAFSYQLSTEHQGGTFRSELLTLAEDAGRALRLAVYPTTTDIRATKAAMGVSLYVSPKPDELEVELSVRLVNVGQNAWVTDGTFLRLPAGSRGFEPGPASGTMSVREAPGGVLLLGTLPPGEQRVGFRVEVPRAGADELLELELPPRVAELRVATEAPKGATLAADGFPPAERSRNEQGQPVLGTTRLADPTSQGLERARVEIRGLPTPSAGRYLAVAGAALVLLAGLGFGLGRRPKRLSDEELQRARALLLAELARLEAAYRRGELGPKTYEATRRTLLDGVARLLRREGLAAGTEPPPAASPAAPIEG